MNQEQTKKTLGQIAMEAYTEGPELGNLMPLRFAKAAEAVRDAVLAELPEWGLVTEGIVKEGDELLDSDTGWHPESPFWFQSPVTQALACRRRLRSAATVPSPLGTPKELRPPASGVDTSATDVPPDEKNTLFGYKVLSEEEKERVNRLVERLKPSDTPISDAMKGFIELTERLGQERDAALKRAEEAESRLSESQNSERGALERERTVEAKLNEKMLRSTKLLADNATVWADRAEKAESELAALRASVPVWVPVPAQLPQCDKNEGENRMCVWVNLKDQSHPVGVCYMDELHRLAATHYFKVPPLPVETDKPKRNEFEDIWQEYLTTEPGKALFSKDVHDATKMAFFSALELGRTSTKP